jgi:hypothetical protein
MSKTSQRVHDRGSEVENLHFGAHPGFLHWAARQALLGGCALRARRLGGCSALVRRLSGDNTLRRLLGGRPSSLCDGRGWTLAPAGDEGQVNVRGSVTPDNVGGQLGGARHSATRWRLARWAPCESGPTAGPLGQDELLVASSTPLSCCAWLFVAAAMTTLWTCREATTSMTPTSRSSQPPH